MTLPTQDSLRQRLGSAVVDIANSHGTLVVVLDAVNLATVARQLKTEFAFDLFLDVTAVDWPDRQPRFEVV